ncbi:methyl-accepting chemotaxis protein [Blastopirellula marina]|uniref:Methyl-accepting chemotaxis protein n=1 Tax=Blastopirellula marina TaxID=124 RepID=A0A2S8GBW9_9BACT|nr:methyl-accepting chemotaxis protein [Blastopirellula marina]PQO41919.1 hypothetical protein C5Y98_02460 [Blastopirellula marina]PTL46277.1 methyl-accepting chemotaxis protein [Blastopirellula marina]
MSLGSKTSRRGVWQWIQSRVAAKLGIGFLVMGVMVIACAATGGYLIHRYDNSLAFLTQEAWRTSGAAMDGVLGVRAQMLAVENIRQGIEVSQNMASLEQSKITTQEAFQTIAETSVIPGEQVHALQEQFQRYNGALEQLVASYTQMDQSWTALREHSNHFVKVGEIVEELGDSTVEELEQNPDKPFTWNGEIREKWEAADGGMESSIGFLTQLFYLEQLKSAQDIPQMQREISEARAFHQEAMSGMLATGRFDAPFTSSEFPQFQGRTYADVYRSLFSRMAECSDKCINDLLAYRTSAANYQQVAAQLVNHVDQLKEASESSVQRTLDQIDGDRHFAVMLLVGVTAIAVCVAIAFGVICTRAIAGPLRRTAEMVHDIAEGEGDLTKRLKVSGQDEIAQLAYWFNTFVEKLQGLIQHIAANAASMDSSASELDVAATSLINGVEKTRGESTSVRKSSEEMQHAIGDVSETINNMSGSMRLVASSIQEMTTTIDDIARNSERAASNMSRTSQLAESSNHKIETLGSAANDIGCVIQEVEDIAEQTNLLALNATIEAARAGEAGKGFAVVATEVKELARQTAGAIDSIRKRITHIQDSSREAVSAISEMNGMISDASNLTNTIASAVEEQNIVTRSIAENVTNASHMTESVAMTINSSRSQSEKITDGISTVDTVTLETSRGAEQNRNTALQMSRLAEELRTLVNQFKV